MQDFDPAAIASNNARGGKGHAPRRTADYDAYASNWDKIFGKKKKKIEEEDYDKLKDNETDKD